MNAILTSIKDIQSTLSRLRQDPKTQRRFPKQVWDSIIELTKIYSVEEICCQLQINPIYLKRKIAQNQDLSLEFQEFSFQNPLSDKIIIELCASSGLKAHIEGPASCLDCIYKLFGR